MVQHTEILPQYTRRGRDFTILRVLNKRVTRDVFWTSVNKPFIILLLRTPEGFHINKSVLTGHVHMSRCHQDMLYIFHNTTPERQNTWPLSLNRQILAACILLPALCE